MFGINLPIDHREFLLGNAPTLEQVLLDREQRMLTQKSLLDQYPDCLLIVLTVNVPGPIKNNSLINRLLGYGESLLLADLARQKLSVIKHKTISTIASVNCFVVVESNDINTVKELTVNLEDNAPLGRLLDIDVHSSQGQISRQALGYTKRRCFVCQKDAKECGRNRSHSVEALHKAICTLINTEGKDL